MARNTAIRGLQIQNAFFGNGLKRNAGDENIAEVALKANMGLEFDNGDIQVKLEANKGLEVGADGIATVLESNEGLKVGAAGLAVDYDNSTIGIVGDKLAVANNGIGITQLDTETTPGESEDGYVAYWNNTAGKIDFKIETAAEAIVEGEIKLEDKTGEVDGEKTSFTLSETPVASSVQVYLNGLLQQEGSGADYQLVGDDVVFEEAPESDDLLIVHYVQKSSE